MKKVLIVLGLAMCTTMSMAQTSKLARQLGMPKKADIAFSEEKAAPVDYKASIFTKAPGDVLATYTFSEADMAKITINVVNATDQIDGAAVGATNAHNRTEPIFRWRRIADTNTVLSDAFAAEYSYLMNYVSPQTIVAYMGSANNVQGNDGFMLLDVTELDEDNTAINTYFTINENITVTGEQMIDVRWRQLYRKYYDLCYVDYNTGSGWQSFEVNVTGVDCEVTGLAPAYISATLPLNAVATGSLQIRFRLFSEGDVPYGYHWMLDDVSVVASPSNAWTFSNLGYLNGFYGMQPEGFSVPLAFAMTGRNLGLNAMNNVTLNGVHAYNGVWDADAFISRNQANMPGMDPSTRYTLILDESGYMVPNTGFDNSDAYYDHAIPDNYSYYGQQTIPASYGKVGLPTTGTGMHQYSLQVRSGENVYELDTIAYTVSENMEVSARDSAMGRTIPGYRWATDNGLIPSGSEFAYQFTTDPTNPLRSGYVSAGGGQYDNHQYANGYMVTTRYNTPAVVPTDWRFRGLELVTSTKLTADEVEGSLIEPYAVIYRFAGETFPGTDQAASDTGFYYMGTGSDNGIFEVGRESAPLEKASGALLPDQPYYAVNILFPEQPVIEPNHMYRFGYVNHSDGTRFAVARTSYSYLRTIDPDTASRYTNNEDYAPYYNQVSPSMKPYDAHAYDPLQGARSNPDNHSVWAYNIDYYPMIRVIVGPKMVLPNYGIFGECSEGDTNFAIYRDGYIWCDVADSVPEQSTVTYYVFPGLMDEEGQTDDYNNLVTGGPDQLIPSRVITDITLDGVSIIDDTNIVTPVDYVHYWEGHTPNDAEPWAPAMVRKYYEVTLRTITADHRIGATTEYRALGIGDVEDAINMTLAPNPATSSVNVNINGFSGKADCSIIDMSGRVVYSTEISNGNTTVSLNGIPAGAYFVRVTNAAFSKVEKLIVR